MLVYANALYVPAPTGSPNSILAAVDSWLLFKTCKALTANAQVNKPSVRLRDGKELEVILAGDSALGQDALGCVIFSHPDSIVSGRKWFTRIGFRHSPTAKANMVTVVLETSDISVHAGSSRVFATRPGVVRALVQNCGLVAPSPEALVHELNADNVSAFADDVYRSDRQYAIILISREPFSERYFVQPSAVLDHVCGLARVVAIPNKAHTKTISDEIGRRFSAWGGAINVIMPPLRNGFVPSQLVTAEQLQFETGRDKSPADYLLYVLTHVLNLPNYRREITAASVRQHALGLRLADLDRQQEGAKQLAVRLSVLQQQLDQKQAEIDRLYDENAKVWAEYESSEQRASVIPGLQAQILSYRQAFEKLKKEGRLEGEVPAPVSSVAQAIELAQGVFAAQLTFSFNSKSEDVESPYDEPEEVFAALRWLATTYYESKISTRECPDLDKNLAETVPGWHYSQHQKKATMQAHKEWYQCPWADAPNGKLWIPEHLKGGAARSRRPEETIRIAFAWEPAVRKVVIGFIGQHQENTKS